MAKFFFFEKIVQLFYTHVFTNPKETYAKTTQLGVTFASGYLAGVVCAIVSHPADSLVSLLGKAENKGKSVGKIYSEVGLATLATKGLGTRVVMIGLSLYVIYSPTFLIFATGTLTGFQWWIYDSFKSAMGMGTTGGK
jgi:solute carrier family 25 phosphate transporter 3